MSINREQVLSWFKGKSYVDMVAALDALDRSIAQGYWEKGWSRKVHAAATKANIAINIGRKAQKARIFEPRPEYGTPGYDAYRHADYAVMSMRHGHVTDRDLSKITTATEALLNNTQLAAVAKARAFYLDLDPVWAAIKRLDATRPKPVFTVIGLSPTMTKTLAGLGIQTGGAAFTIECPPTRWVEEERVDAKGNVYYVTVGHLEWPEGTCHHTSRFPMMGADGSTARCMQCESCGHGIRNRYNWVPLLVLVEGQAPRSLWVGRDCARNLFGFEIEGELEFVNQPISAAEAATRNAAAPALQSVEF